MTVKRFARKDVVTAPPDASVVDLARLMKDRDVGSVVVTSDDAPVGVVTDRDLVVYALAEERRDLTARDLMDEDLFTVDARDDVFTVARELRERGVRRAPVVEYGDLVGIVTFDDLVVVLANELQNLAGVVEAESPPYRPS